MFTYIPHTFIRFVCALSITAAALGFSLQAAHAVSIQRVISPSGIEAWLVEDHTVPIVALNFSFKGGAAQDPVDKAGLTRLLTSTLDEGAGTLPSEAFQSKMEELSVGLGFSAGKDYIYGSLRTLSPNTEKAFDLLRLAVNEPRFDVPDVTRVKEQIAVGIRRRERDPDSIASRNLFKSMLGDHPYVLPSSGTEESLSLVTPDDLQRQRQRLFAKQDLKIGVVGAINAQTLAPLLDSVFGALPEKPQLNAVPEFHPNLGDHLTTEIPGAQTRISFGLQGLKRQDPDYPAAFVMNHILGGGSFTSWLYQEVREKRGLTYSTGSSLSTSHAGGLLLGSASTRPDRAEETLEVILAQFKRMAEAGPTQDELNRAKTFLTGSYPLRFDSSGKIARQLVALQNANLGIDYFDRRNAEVEAVTLEDVRRAAKRLIGNAEPTISIAGPQS